MSRKHLDKRLIALLDDCGLPWALELGKKHAKLRLDGHLVLVVSHGSRTDRRMQMNALAHVRRAVDAIRRGERPG